MRNWLIGLSILPFTIVAQPKHLIDVEFDYSGNVYVASESGPYIYDGERYYPLNQVYKDLPAAWSKDIEIKDEYIAISYESDGLHLIDIANQKSTKLSTETYSKLSLGHSLLAVGDDGELDLFNTQSLEKSEPLKGRVLATDGQYVATVEGLFKVTATSIKPITRTNFKNVKISQTSLGVAVWANGELRHYNTAGEYVGVKLNAKPRFLYSKGDHIIANIKGEILRFSLLTLSIEKDSVTHHSNANQHKENSNRTWSVNYGHIRANPVKTLIEQTPIQSEYTVLHANKNSLYVGVDNKLFKRNGLDWVLLETFDDEITAIDSIGDTIIASTEQGLYVQDFRAFRKVWDGYIIDIEAQRNTALLATDDHKVQVFSSITGKVSASPINEFLPDDEIISIRRYADTMYVTTNGGVYEFQNSELTAQWLDEVKIMDTAIFNGSIYAATYGNGLFKKVNGKALALAGSPKLIVEMKTVNDRLILGTTEGLFEYSDERFIRLTEKLNVSAGSITIVDDFILAGATNSIISTSLEAKHFAYRPFVTGWINNNNPAIGNLRQINAETTYQVLLSSEASYTDDVHYQYSLGDNWIDAHNATINVRYSALGSHTINIRASSDGANWTDGAPITLNVVGPWYYSNAAKAAAAAALLAFFGGVIMYYRRRADKTGALLAKNLKSDTFRADQVLSSIASAHAILVADDPYLVHDAMTALQDGIDTLLPDVQNRGGLAGRELHHGLDAMIVQLRTEYRDITFDSDIAINNKQRYNAQFESSVYMVLHHAVQLAVARHNVSNVHVAVYKDANTLTLTVTDDSPLMINPFKRTTSNSLILDLLCNDQCVKPQYKTHWFKRNDKRNVTSISFNLPTPITQLAAINTEKSA